LSIYWKKELDLYRKRIEKTLKSSQTSFDR